MELWDPRLAKCDLYFAEHLCPTHPELFAYLLACSREGHLCIEFGEQTLNPSWGKWDVVLLDQIQHVHHPSLVKEEGRLYLKRNYDVEKLFLTHLERLSRASILHCQPDLHGDLNSEQERAIRTAFQQPVTWISGGPGTGKSYTAACLIRSFRGSTLAIAPTGKAAANLRKKLPEVPVGTIHALLAKRQLIDADLVVIDEGSMVDAQTYAQLFSKIKSGARVAVFGDQHQLPPISSGHFFAYCAAAENCQLKTCLRTDLKEIIDLAEAVKKGEMISAAPLSAALPWREATILTPLRQGPYGVEALNRQISQQVSKDKIPIMITQNCPPLDLYNGDGGWLYPDHAVFGEQKISRHQLPPYEFAYVLSVHKSQGSEYDHVVVLLPEGSERFGREMLYTAITRARRSVKVLAAESILEKVLQTSSNRLWGGVRSCWSGKSKGF